MDEAYKKALEKIKQAEESGDPILDLSGMGLTTLTPEIGNLTNLTQLILNWNQLTTLTPEIGNLANLTELYLNGNKLTTLPAEFGNLTNLTNLTELGLKGNPIEEIPPEVLENEG